MRCGERFSGGRGDECEAAAKSEQRGASVVVYRKVRVEVRGAQGCAKIKGRSLRPDDDRPLELGVRAQASLAFEARD